MVPEATFDCFFEFNIEHSLKQCIGIQNVLHKQNVLFKSSLYQLPLLKGFKYKTELPGDDTATVTALWS